MTPDYLNLNKDIEKIISVYKKLAALSLILGLILGIVVGGVTHHYLYHWK